jgi:hypothetical protein
VRYYIHGATEMGVFSLVNHFGNHVSHVQPMCNDLFATRAPPERLQGPRSVAKWTRLVDKVEEMSF